MQGAIHVAENRFAARDIDRACRGNETNGRADDFRARTDAGRNKGAVQRPGAGTQADRIPDAENLPGRPLKGLDFAFLQSGVLVG